MSVETLPLWVEIHEAGHFMCNEALGLPMLEVGAHQVRLPAGVYNFFDLATATLGGLAATLTGWPQVPRHLHLPGARKDLRRVEGLLQRWPAGQRDKVMQDAMDRAMYLMWANWATVRRVAPMIAEGFDLATIRQNLERTKT